MTQIILTKEQVDEMTQSVDYAIQLCDPDGKVLRTFKHEDSPEFIAELKRRAAAPGPRYTTEQVKEHLKAFEEEWHRVGRMDRAQIRAFFERFDAANRDLCMAESHGT